MANNEIVSPGYEIWFTPPRGAMIGVKLLNGVVTIYHKPEGEDEHWNVLFTLPPGRNPDVIIDDFTRAEEGPPPSANWLRGESIIEP